MTFILGDDINNVPRIHVGDYGTVLIATVYNQDEVVVDISSATSMIFRFKKPDTTTVDKTGVLYTDGTDGKLTYTAEDGLFSAAGSWQYTVILTFPSGKWQGSPVEFTVYSAIGS